MNYSKCLFLSVLFIVGCSADSFRPVATTQTVEVDPQSGGLNTEPAAGSNQGTGSGSESDGSGSGSGSGSGTTPGSGSGSGTTTGSGSGSVPGTTTGSGSGTPPGSTTTSNNPGSNGAGDDKNDGDDDDDIQAGGPGNSGNAPGHSGDGGKCENAPGQGADAAGDSNACAKALGISLSTLRIAGRHKDMKLDVGQSLLVRVTGNQNQAELTVKPSGESVEGLCIFVAGNQARVTVKVQGALQNLHIVGRGNKCQVNVQVAEGGKVQNAIVSDLSGNQAALNISGSASNCPTVRSTGKYGPKLNCP